jgi:hypothetical protein
MNQPPFVIVVTKQAEKFSVVRIGHYDAFPVLDVDWCDAESCEPAQHVTGAQTIEKKLAHAASPDFA